MSAYVIERHIVIGETDNISYLDFEGDFSGLDFADVFHSYEEAERHFKPDEDPNNLNPRIDEVRWEIKQFPFLHCPICWEMFSIDDMMQTYDCHGIPYRHVCPDCYDIAMERGYDGEYYNEADEHIDFD